MKSEELPKERTNANGEKPAYPWNQQFVGLTKREAFAMAAMQGLLATCDTDQLPPNIQSVQYIADLSVKAADALLKELEHGSK